MAAAVVENRPAQASPPVRGEPTRVAAPGGRATCTRRTGSRGAGRAGHSGSAMDPLYRGPLVALESCRGSHPGVRLSMIADT
jgi:hypothetical protein